MIKPDLLWLTLINCNNDYQQITQERKPVVKQPKLKNVTPAKPEKLDYDRGTACVSCNYQFSGLNDDGEIGWEDCYCTGRRFE